MPISNYAHGFLNGVTIRDVPIQQLHPGKVFYVNSSNVTTVDGVAGSNANRGTYQKPFATLTYAITQCKASRGDIICLLPGYTQTLSSANAIDMSIAGVAVIGLGRGTKKATFTLDTADTTCLKVSSFNNAFINCVFSANYADIATCINATTAKYLTLVDCEFVDTATNMNFLYIVDSDTTANRCDGVYVERCKWISPDLACVSFLKMDAAQDDIAFVDNYINLGVNNSKGAFIAGGANNVTNLRIRGNRVIRLNTTNAGALIASSATGCSGFISDNYVQMADGTNNLMIPASTGLSCAQNFYSGAADKSGFLNPVADA
jgi:hypothetical protein